MAKNRSVKKTLVRSKTRRRYHGGLKGKKTGLSLSAYLRQIFCINEEQAKSTKLTDDDILISCTQEFGRGNPTLTYLANKRNVTIGSYRNKFNKEPMREIISLRYNAQGHPCTRYDVPIDLEEVREMCLRFGVIDPRFFTPQEIRMIYRKHLRGEEEYVDLHFASEETIKKFPYGSVDFARRKGNSHVEVSDE